MPIDFGFTVIAAAGQQPILHNRLGLAAADLSERIACIHLVEMSRWRSFSSDGVKLVGVREVSVEPDREPRRHSRLEQTEVVCRLVGKRHCCAPRDAVASKLVIATDNRCPE